MEGGEISSEDEDESPLRRPLKRERINSSSEDESLQRRGPTSSTACAPNGPEELDRRWARYYDLQDRGDASDA